MLRRTSPRSHAAVSRGSSFLVIAALFAGFLLGLADVCWRDSRQERLRADGRCDLARRCDVSSRQERLQRRAGGRSRCLYTL